MTKRLRLEDRIYERKKYARLTDSDKLLAVKEVKLNKRNIKEAAKFLNTRSSTIKRIQYRMWNEGASTQKWFNLKSLSKQITLRTEKSIKSFIDQRKQWYNSSHIKDHIKKDINQDVSCSKIRKYLKEKGRQNRDLFRPISLN